MEDLCWGSGRLFCAESGDFVTRDVLGGTKADAGAARRRRERNCFIMMDML